MFAQRTEAQLHSYHQNSSLLFQFLLSEFLQTSLCMQKLLYHAGSTDSLSVTAIIDTVTELCGSPYGQSRFFSWSYEGGYFSKLKNYSILLCRQNKDDKEFRAIERCAALLWTQALPLTEIIDRTDISSGADFHRTLKKMSVALRRLTGSIIKTIPQFQDDENVLYFILRHADHLDHLFKSDFTLKLFNQLFANGIQEASQLLLQKYAKRGFHRLLPTIRRQISALQSARS